jgi:acyl-CoA hydrolase/GNAT superfamily N-acetyltransferase
MGNAPEDRGIAPERPDDPSWRERYREKLATPEEAVQLVPPGRRILIGSGAAEPVRLVEALVARSAGLADNEIVHLLTLGPAPYVRPEHAGRFRHSAFFIGPNVREAVQDGRADFLPVFLSEIPELIRRRRVRIDVALIQVSPPDVHGFVSLGVSVDVVRAAVEAADLVLAEVNPRMPRTHGDSFVPVSRLHRLVPVDAPLLELRPEPPGDVERQIGQHVASLVADGATLQVGIGRIPDAVLAALAGHRDLGVHTEMLSDGVMELVEAGVITGAKKTLLPGKLVTSFVMGSQALYEWAHDNPALDLRASDFTNDPAVIALNDRMVSINSALAVDLTGQVASDTLRGRFFSGIGGQVDFVRGASRSRGGKAIIALPSTARNGEVSRIRAVLEEGAGVVTSRGDVHYVVTEYGVADLWGRNIRERALALIEIAHPKFRAELLEAARSRHFVSADQIIPRATYPYQEVRHEHLRDGTHVLVRPARLSDEEALQDLFYRLSQDSTYQRFFRFKNRYPHDEMQRLVDLDYERNMALVVCELDRDEPIAMAQYQVDPATGLGDVAFVVRDDWQRRGIGPVLLRRMAEIGRARGLSGLEADVLATNTPMLTVFHRSGLALQSTLDAGVFHIVMPFAAVAAPGACPPVQGTQ